MHYAKIFGSFFSIMRYSDENDFYTIVLCSFAHPSFYLRSSSVPKSVQSRCKVGGEAKNHRVWYGEIREDYGKHYGRNSKFLYIHIPCVSTSFKHFVQGKVCFLDKVITDVIRMGGS